MPTMRAPASLMKIIRWSRSAMLMNSLLFCTTEASFRSSSSYRLRAEMSLNITASLSGSGE